MENTSRVAAAQAANSTTDDIDSWFDDPATMAFIDLLHQIERTTARLSKLIERLPAGFDEKEHADYLFARGDEGDAACHVGVYLADVWHYMRDRVEERRPKCAVCGNDELYRPNARYCSDACRQKAFRQRNRSKGAARTKRNGSGRSLRSAPSSKAKNVTARPARRAESVAS
jgi:hypothetical protein